MRRNPLVLISALGTLALLAACGAKQQTATEETAEAAAAAADATAAATAAPGSATAQPAPATATAPKPVTSKPATSTAAAKPAPPAPKPVTVLIVPAGTELALALSTPLSSKSAKVGDTVRALVTSDVTVDGKLAIASGTTVAGSVIKVVSGSDKIGGTPTLAIAFDRLELPGGVDVPISGEITQKGKSDTARDTVKIVGGASAGAILGNETIKGDKGKVIGGILGGAIGAAAAQKTGTEVQLTEGTALSIALGAPVEIKKP